MNDNWVMALALDEVPEDDVVGVEIEGRDIAVYGVDGEVFATDNICTHGHARLSDGFLEDGRIECPLHQGQFCVKSGKAMTAPLTEDIKSYPVRIADGKVFVAIS